MNREQREDFLQDLVKRIRRQEFPYESKPAQKIDWHAYERAQINEVNDMLLCIRDFVDEAGKRMELTESEEKHPGQPPIPFTDLAKAVLLQQYFGMSNRETEGLTILFKEKLGLTRTFSYKSIERAYGNPDVKRLLQIVFDMTQEQYKEKENSIAVDGTGHSTSQKINYENNRSKNKSMKGFKKVLTAIGTTFKLYVSCIVLNNPEDNENPYFPLVINKLQEYTNLETVSGDAGLLSRDNCNLVAKLGARPRFLPRTNSTFKRNGSDAYVHMLHELITDPQDWLREYHQRSIAESGYSAQKRKNPQKLKRRIEVRKDTEIFTRYCNENLRRVVYLNYLLPL